jgi:hypothetical protein
MNYINNALEHDPLELRDLIEKQGYVIFKNYLSIDMAELRNRLYSLSGGLRDYPSKINPEDPISIFKKINLGDFGSFGEYPRFFRTIYTPYWLEGCEFSSELFVQLIMLRNHIAGLNLDLALKPDSDKGIWSGCRFQHYFSGGGFFSEHTDIVVEKISNEIAAPTIQLVALITTKGVDFDDGGASIRNSKGELINIEDYASSGDVIAYDASSLHGVLPVDQHKPLDLNMTSGRIVALASIYKLL